MDTKKAFLSLPAIDTAYLLEKSRREVEPGRYVITIDLHGLSAPEKLRVIDIWRSELRRISNDIIATIMQ